MITSLHATPEHSRLLFLTHHDLAEIRKSTAKALREGRIHRGTHCEHCGDCQAKLDGHHSSYFEPLALTFLCRACHRREHLRLERLGLDPLLLWAAQLVASGTSRTVNELLALESNMASRAAHVATVPSVLTQQESCR